VWQPSRLTRLPHMSRPIGRPGFDSFLTNRVLTKSRLAKKCEKHYKMSVFFHIHQVSASRLPLRWKCRVLGNRYRGFESPSLRFEVARCGDLASYYANTFDKSAAQPSFKIDRSWRFDKNPARAHARGHDFPDSINAAKSKSARVRMGSAPTH
jgi:hypothetical protein